MMGQCDYCPTEEGVETFLQLVMWYEENMDFEHWFMQWVSTDRCELLETTLCMT